MLHHVTFDDVKEYSGILPDLAGFTTATDSVDDIAEKIRGQYSSPSSEWPAASGGTCSTATYPRRMRCSASREAGPRRPNGLDTSSTFNIAGDARGPR